MRFFPFSMVRPGQKEMVEAVEETCKAGGVLLVHAPTGIGKTAGALAPALEYAVEHDKVVVFLTPRHTQHKVAIDTVRRINNRAGVHLKVVDIIGKKWLCKMEGIDTLSSSEFNEYCRALKKNESCPYYNSTWDGKGGLSKKAESILKSVKRDVLYAEDVHAICDDLCPYEIIMQATRDANLLIGDYYHIFHESVRKSFLGRANKKLEDTIVVVDEAHNLPSRIRELMSTSTSILAIKKAEREAEAFGYDDLAEMLGLIRKKVAERLKDKFKSDGITQAYIGRSMLIDAVEESGTGMDEMLDYMEEVADEVREEKKRSYIGGFASFLRRWMEEKTIYCRIAERTKTKKGNVNYRLLLYCMDPSPLASEVFKEAHATILMSGTLLPLDMYADVLGVSESKARKLKLKSHFPRNNRLEIVVDDVTTQYSKRDEKNFEKIARYLVSIINMSPDNVCVFFPSYELRDIMAEMITISVQKEVLMETQGMSKSKKAELFSRFVRAVEHEGACLLGVIGGSFDQGVDFPNNIVKCVVIVGLPLEKPDLLTEAMINYYEAKFGRGWDYAYIYPAIVKAQQAAGRAIRSERDRAVIVYMDRRYLWASYRKCFPSETRFVVSRTPAELIKRFFNQSS